MSNIYIQEPPTQGKVLLQTTLGDLDIELWSREAPKACRNFIQLCMEGYYDGTIFHRVIKGFIAQGGDPEGTGMGGESIYGGPFKNEIHSRLRFCRRGLVALANSGTEDNGSQFFFTLAATPELQNKHTIFGKIAGDTIYNMVKFEELDVDRDDRPTYPPKILSTEILNNPFEDIVPRVVKAKKSEKKSSKGRSAGVKNYNLLSFGDEAEEEEEDLVSVMVEKKSKSAHDLVEDPKLSSEPALKRLKGSSELIENEIVNNENSETDEIDKDQKPAFPNSGTINTEKSKALIADLMEERSKYDSLKKSAKVRGSSREALTMELLNKFKSKIISSKLGEDEGNQSSWMNHEFKCVDKELKLAKDANTKDNSWFEISDPRNELNVRKREKKAKK